MNRRRQKRQSTQPGLASRHSNSFSFIVAPVRQWREVIRGIL